MKWDREAAEIPRAWGWEARERSCFFWKLGREFSFLLTLIFKKSISLLNPLPHLITKLPMFPLLARPVFLQLVMLLCVSPVTSLCFPPTSVHQRLTLGARPSALMTFAGTLSLIQRRKIFFFFFVLSTIKPKETGNVYFSYDIFLMLLSDRNSEK